MKHTKGEWIVRELDDTFIEVSNPVKGERNGICEILANGCNKRGEEGRANAKLIAAAPDLLLAAMNLLQWKGYTPKHCKENLAAAIKKAIE